MRRVFVRPRVRRVALAVLALLAVLAGVVAYSQLTAFSYGDLLAALRGRGATVQESGPASNVLFNGAGHGLLANGAQVAAYEYGTTFAASMDAARISSDGSTARGGLGPFGGGAVTVDWIAPPHHYLKGRIIVTYVGADAGTLALLTATLGPQFAGGAIPEPSREGGQPLFVVVSSAWSAGPAWRELPGEV